MVKVFYHLPVASLLFGNRLTKILSDTCYGLRDGNHDQSLLFNESLIDEIQVFIMPIIIPGGVEIFELLPQEKVLKLVNTKTYPSGVIELRYDV